MYKIIWFNDDGDEIGALGSFDMRYTAIEYARLLLPQVCEANYSNWGFDALPKTYAIKKYN